MIFNLSLLLTITFNWQIVVFKLLEVKQMMENLENTIKNPKNKKIVMAPMAGITDGKFSTKFKGLFAIYTLGGHNLDSITYNCSISIEKRGRKEFIYPLHSIVDLIKKDILLTRECGGLVSINVRFKNLSECKNILRELDNYTDIIELNCHCRQKEITSVGLGQELLKKENNHILKKILEGMKNLNLKSPVFLKIRCNVIDTDDLIDNLKNVDNYFDGLHIDGFNPNKDYCDLESIKKISSSFKDKVIIGNNSIRCEKDAKTMLKYCDYASVARCLLGGNVDWIKGFNSC